MSGTAQTHLWCAISGCGFGLFGSRVFSADSSSSSRNAAVPSSSRTASSPAAEQVALRRQRVEQRAGRLAELLGERRIRFACSPACSSWWAVACGHVAYFSPEQPAAFAYSSRRICAGRRGRASRRRPLGRATDPYRKRHRRPARLVATGCSSTALARIAAWTTAAGSRTSSARARPLARGGDAHAAAASPSGRPRASSARRATLAAAGSAPACGSRSARGWRRRARRWPWAVRLAAGGAAAGGEQVAAAGATSACIPRWRSWRLLGRRQRRRELPPPPPPAASAAAFASPAADDDVAFVAGGAGGGGGSGGGGGDIVVRCVGGLYRRRREAEACSGEVSMRAATPRVEGVGHRAPEGDRGGGDTRTARAAGAAAARGSAAARAAGRSTARQVRHDGSDAGVLGAVPRAERMQRSKHARRR